jgi:branched-chain amino acid transport system ATP-binding protein
VSELLELRGVSAAYGSAPVLWSLDLHVPQGGVVAVLGANGAGKTTLLRAICNMVVLTRGEIRLDGTRIDRRSTEDIARLGVAHVPEGRGTFEELTVEENLRLGAYARPPAKRRRSGAVPEAALAHSEGDSRAEAVYQYFPILAERRHQLAGTLSGGEQQMLAIGRALMSGPRLLLLDEPSFGLAPIMVRKIFDILAAIQRAQGVGVLLVEQNAELALELASQAVVLEAGRAVMNGAARDIAGNDAVRRAYLGA